MDFDWAVLKGVGLIPHLCNRNMFRTVGCVDPPVWCDTKQLEILADFWYPSSWWCQGYALRHIFMEFKHLQIPL